VQVIDDDGHVETQVIAISVTAVNDAGTFGGDVSATTNEDTATTGTVTFMDTADGFTTPNFTINTAATNGTATINAAGNWTYTPSANFNGADSFTVQVIDDDGHVETQVIAISVTAVNDAGTFGGDVSATTNEDTATTGTVTFVDTADGFTTPNFTINTAATNGTATIDAAGNWTYTPNANFNGADSFTVQVIDDDGHVETQVIAISVTAVNDAGTFGGDVSATTNEDTATTGTVTFVDTADGFTTPNFTINTAATNGTATIDAAGNWTYTPNANFNGADSFTVQVIDDDGHVETQVIAISVTAVNDAGTFGGDVSATTNEDTATTGTVTFVDTADGFTTPNFTINTAATNGTATIDAAGNWTYTPNANFNGADSFTVQVIDDDGHVETQVIAISVTAVNDAGTFGGDVSATTNEDTATTGTVTFVDTADGFTTPNFTINTAATNGTATINAAGNWTYTPNANFNGADSFTVHCASHRSMMLVPLAVMCQRPPMKILPPQGQ
jgi:VCBS repeat-containing protein